MFEDRNTTFTHNAKENYQICTFEVSVDVVCGSCQSSNLIFHRDYQQGLVLMVARLMALEEVESVQILGSRILIQRKKGEHWHFLIRDVEPIVRDYVSNA